MIRLYSLEQLKTVKALVLELSKAAEAAPDTQLPGVFLWSNKSSARIERSAREARGSELKAVPMPGALGRFALGRQGRQGRQGRHGSHGNGT